MDELLEEEVDEDLETFDDGENLEQNLPIETNQEDLEGENQNDEDDEEKEKKQVKPKKVIKNPRVTLNAERLKGPKGLDVLESCFEKVKFKGKGHEEEDLNVLLKTYEYWCHRLFPKFPFQDSIEKIEKLGSKGPIQTHLKKVRSGMIEDDLHSLNGTGADLRSDEEHEREDATASQTAAQIATQTLIEDIPIELTEEQLETIRRNRAKAERLRQERLQKIQEKASLNLPERNIEAPIARSRDVVEEDRQSPETSTLEMTIHEATINDIDQKLPEHSSSKKITSHVEDTSEAGDASENENDEADYGRNGKSELYHQNFEATDVEIGHESVVGNDLENKSGNGITSTTEITDYDKESETENEYSSIEKNIVSSDP